MTKTIINATNNTTKKVDFFQASREMSVRVSEFMRCTVMKRDIELTYNKKIDDLKKSLENMENLQGSILSSNIDALKQSACTQIVAWEDERKKLIEETAKFELTENDKSFKKAINNAPMDVVGEHVKAWFMNYNLNIDDTLFFDELMTRFGFKIDFKTLVVSNGKNCLKLDNNKVLKIMYATAYEHMVSVGTIKECEIPVLLREKYGKKSKKTK